MLIVRASTSSREHGNTTIHQLPVSTFAFELPTSTPSDVEPPPGCGPKPKKPRVDSARTAATTENVRATRIGPMAFGSRWRSTTRTFDAPSARDASMNSRSLRART